MLFIYNLYQVARTTFFVRILSKHINFQGNLKKKGYKNFQVRVLGGDPSALSMSATESNPTILKF